MKNDAEARPIGLEIRSLNNLIRRYFDRSPIRREIESVTGNNGYIIRFLSQNRGRDVFQKDLEEQFTITRSTASRVLGLMEQKGLIERQSVERDARLKKIVLTDRACRMVRMMCSDGEQMERRLVSGFTADELGRLHGYLRRMKQNLTGPAPAPAREPEGERLC